jgi:hypothetical protein
MDFLPADGVSLKIGLLSFTSGLAFLTTALILNWVCDTTTAAARHCWKLLGFGPGRSCATPAVAGSYALCTRAVLPVAPWQPGSSDTAIGGLGAPQPLRPLAVHAQERSW